jgi:steroid 5-alpha reductase family enzyme
MNTFVASAGAILVSLFLLWLVSLKLRDSSIVDIFWGLGFVLIGWVTFALADGVLPRRLLIASLTTLWGGRLSAYLAWRNLGKGEDPRYVAMRARHGEKWPLRSLFQVFILQGALMFLVSLPIQVAQHAQTPPALGLADALGAGLVLLGVLIEGLGDLQLARFKAQPDNRGKVMDQGLWRYTRHPNYFGDFVVWWGLYVIALGTGSAWWTVVGPLVMSILLMRVSGVTLLEKSLKQRPGYAEYVRRTSPFFPRPPRT